MIDVVSLHNYITALKQCSGVTKLWHFDISSLYSVKLTASCNAVEVYYCFGGLNKLYLYSFRYPCIGYSDITSGTNPLTVQEIGQLKDQQKQFICEKLGIELDTLNSLKSVFESYMEPLLSERIVTKEICSTDFKFTSDTLNTDMDCVSLHFKDDTLCASRVYSSGIYTVKSIAHGNDTHNAWYFGDMSPQQIHRKYHFNSELSDVHKMRRGIVYYCIKTIRFYIRVDSPSGSSIVPIGDLSKMVTVSDTVTVPLNDNGLDSSVMLDEYCIVSEESDSDSLPDAMTHEERELVVSDPSESDNESIVDVNEVEVNTTTDDATTIATTSVVEVEMGVNTTTTEVASPVVTATTSKYIPYIPYSYWFSNYSTSTGTVSDTPPVEMVSGTNNYGLSDDIIAMVDAILTSQSVQ